MEKLREDIKAKEEAFGLSVEGESEGEDRGEEDTESSEEGEEQKKVLNISSVSVPLAPPGKVSPFDVEEQTKQAGAAIEQDKPAPAPPS